MDIIMDTIDVGSRGFVYCRDAMNSRDISTAKGFIASWIFNLSTLKNYGRDAEVFDFPIHTFVVKEKYLDKYILKEPPRTAHIVYL